MILLIKLMSDSQCSLALQQVNQAGVAAAANAEVRAFEQADAPTVYMYVALKKATSPEAVNALQAALAAQLPGAQCVLLEQTLSCSGASAGLDAPWHYVVETDVAPDAESDFNAWYDTEHLPGLARVPGTVRAERFIARVGTPKYYACYDLHTRETFGSEPWLAVRATDWSSRVRPNFMNTGRTMFRRLTLSDQG